MSEMSFQETTFQNLQIQNQEGVERVYKHWANKTLADVYREMDHPTDIDLDNGRGVQLVEIEPDEPYYENPHAIALGLPFLNGYTPHHYFRAKTLQLLAAPETPIWIMPNNSYKNSAYTLSSSDHQRLATGDFKPIGELEMRAFQKLHTLRRLSSLSITGYSQGGLTALAMGAAGSDRIHVDVINADEIPSKDYRNAKQLRQDFKSGGPAPLFGAVEDADIDALSQAMTKPKVLRDLARFWLQSLREENRLLQHAMTGSANSLVAEALENVSAVKLGYVEDSPMFDPDSIDETQDNLTIVKYEDAAFSRGHATGDNVVNHALMANHGFNQ